MNLGATMPKAQRIMVKQSLIFVAIIRIAWSGQDERTLPDYLNVL